MVTLKSGRSLRGQNGVNAGASTSSTNAQPKNSQRRQQQPKSRLESRDAESSLPPPPRPPSSLLSASEATFDSLVVVDSTDVEDLVAKKKGDEEEDTDEEGPDYEPVSKRTKRDTDSPKELLTIDDDDDDDDDAPTRSDSPALTVLYDMSADRLLQSLAPADSDVEEVTFVKVTTTVRQPLIVIDDDDEEIVDSGDRRRKREISSTSSMSKVGDVGGSSDKKKGVEGVGDGEERHSGTPPLNEADEAVVSAAIEIMVDDTPEEFVTPADPTPSPPRQPRQPITASVEEIVPEKYRTLFFTFSSSSITDDALWTLFTQFGEIQTLAVDVCPPNAVKRQGRVIFLKFYAVDGCVKAKPLSVGGVDVNIRRTEEKVEKNQRPDQIYVSGIYHLTTQDLTRYFQSFGAIKETIVKSARGFAFVIFEDGDSVEKTLLQQYHQVDGLTLEVKRAFVKNPNAQRRPPPDPFRRPAPPKFDKGPRGRDPTLPVSITPFPRLSPISDIKPKKEEDGGVPLDRCDSATSGSIASNHYKVKDEVKTEV